MVKNHILSIHGKSKRARNLVFTCVLKNISMNIRDTTGFQVTIKAYFVRYELFPAHPIYSLISGIYGVVVTSQNGGDKA